MGENPSAQTERELIALRSHIANDADHLVAMAKRDIDPRTLLRRNPMAVLGAAGSIGTLVLGTLARRGRDPKKANRSEKSAGERAMDAGIVIASSALTNFAGQAAKRFVARIFDEPARK